MKSNQISGHGRLLLLGVLLMTVFILCGCSKDNITVEGIPSPMPSNILQATVTPTAAPTAEPTSTPTPSPTPVIDRSASSFEPVDRSGLDTTSVSIEQETLALYLNPFYFQTEEEQEIVDKTQLKLLYVDENGEALAGIDYPCFAYSIEKTSDTEEWDTYRIVLKEGINFANGNPIAVDDVLFTIYTRADENFDGTGNFSELNIYGLKEYNTQISAEVRETAQRYIDAGINDDGTIPESVVNADEWHEIWDKYDEAGLKFTQDIVDAVINNEKLFQDAYIQAFLSTGLTRAHIEADDHLKVLYAMKLYGYIISYNFTKGTIRDCFDVVHDMAEEEVNVEFFWNLIKQNYGYNFSENNGINYERAIDDKYFEDYLAEIYYASHKGVADISGITSGTVTDADGAERSYIDITIGSDTDIADCNIYVASKAFYSENSSPYFVCGAGEYLLAESTDSTISLIANKDYLLGEPVVEHITYFSNSYEEEEGGT